MVTTTARTLRQAPKDPSLLRTTQASRQLHTSVWANLPALASPAHPPRHPRPGEIKLQLSSLGNSPSTFMAIRTRWTAGGPRRADHICHDWVSWGYGAPSRDRQGDGETASRSQLKYRLSTHQLCALDTSPVSLVCKMEVILVPNSSSCPEDLTRPLKIFLTIWFKSILGTGQTS